jgi:hypothetical protein
MRNVLRVPALPAQIRTTPTLPARSPINRPRRYSARAYSPAPFLGRATAPAASISDGGCCGREPPARRRPLRLITCRPGPSLQRLRAHSVLLLDTHANPVGSHGHLRLQRRQSTVIPTAAHAAVTKVTPTVPGRRRRRLRSIRRSVPQLNATFTAIVNGGAGRWRNGDLHSSGKYDFERGCRQTLLVNFVPTDTADYNNASGSR